ncbi:MAG: MmcB family DNA repair protein [Alphaproteobacteria bacterium]|nr:MmcB family DNA repair protein [Alphaproteobacteria bacterium]
MGLKNGDYGEANVIKTALVNFLLDTNGAELIINELPFLSCKRAADLAAIKDGNLIGFEIKSKVDNLRTMLAQIADYQKIFNSVYLVYSHKFINSIEIKHIPKAVGLIMVDDANGLILKRKAISKISLDKSAMISVLWRKDLEKLVKQNRNLDFEQLKEMVTRQCTIKRIQKQIAFSLYERYGEGYELLLKEKGQRVIIEDLSYITSTKKHLVAF